MSGALSNDGTTRRLGAAIIAAAALLIGMLAVPAAAAAATTNPAAGSTSGVSRSHKVEFPTREALRAKRAASAAVQPAPQPQLTYRGGVHGIGVTTGAPLTFVVFWGSQWGTPSVPADNSLHLSGDPQQFAPRVQALLKGIGTNNETWSGVATQYCEGVAVGATSCPANAPHVGYPTGGTLAGVWADGSVAAPSNATDHQIAVEAVNAAAHFGNVNAGANRSAQYVIVSPTGTHPGGFNTPSGNFCAWHDYNGDPFLIGGPAASPYGDIAFTNLPYLTDLGVSCGKNFVNAGAAGNLDGVTIVEGHEFSETITDQNPAGGWVDSTGEENADKCSWNGVGGLTGSINVAFATGSFAMQATWANDAAACRNAHPLVGVPANDFSVSVSPLLLTTTPGSTPSATVSTTVVRGAPGPAFPALRAAPAGVTGVFTPASAPIGTPMNLALTVAPSVAPGIYPLTVRTPVATAGVVVTHSAVLILKVVANAPPVSSFTATCNGLSCSFDGSASSDSDGSIVSYAWNFGDSTTGSGVATNHAFAAAGSYLVSLVVTDNAAATGSSSQTVNPSTSNVSPTASFTATCTNLSCSFDGSASSDDGSIVSYAWDFSDGSTATGVTANHPFTAAGSYPVTLTVTDNQSATGSLTQAVNATAPPNPVNVSDTFGRSVANGWGTADTGGPWTLGAATTAFQVNGSAGVMNLSTAPVGASARLLSQLLTDSDLRVRIAGDKAATGNGQWGALVVRRASANNEYRIRLRFMANNTVGLSISRVVAGAETLIGSETVVPGLVFAPNTFFDLRAQVVGTNPTTIRARAWLDGQPEPSTWLQTQTDSSAAMQAPGAVGLWSYLSPTSTAPVAMSFDDLTVTPPAPTAAFTATPAAPQCNVNGSASVAAAGSIAGYTWTWGDGALTTGPTSNHNYAAPGTYTITLTVTDTAGTTNTIQHTCTV